mgnify:CR=1 FL=1
MARPRTGSLSQRKRGSRLIWHAQITVEHPDGTKKRPIYSLDTTDRVVAEQKLRDIVAAVAVADPFAGHLRESLAKVGVQATSVAKHGDQWTARIRMPDGSRPRVALGRHADMSEAVAAAKIATWLEQGFVERIAAGRTEKDSKLSKLLELAEEFGGVDQLLDAVAALFTEAIDRGSANAPKVDECGVGE